MIGETKVFVEPYEIEVLIDKKAKETASTLEI
jgi:hypothetical protein